MCVLKMEDEVLCLMSYVKISEYRLKTLLALSGDNVEIPTMIAKKTGILRNHISKVLKELVDADLCECINPDAHKGKLYRLTELGSVVKKGIVHDDNGYERYSLFELDDGCFKVKDNVNGDVITSVNGLVDLLNELYR